MQPSDSALKKNFRVSLLISAALMSSVLIYALALHLLLKSAPPQNPALAKAVIDQMRLIFYGVSFMDLALCFVVRRLMLAPADSVLSAEIKLHKLFIANLVTFVFAEAVGILGFALGFISRDAHNFHPFMIISLIMMAIFFPRYGQWEAWFNGR